MSRVATTLITRDEARFALTHAGKRSDGFNRLRNYEVEAMLDRALGGSHVIAEWCPFNWIYCAWIEHAPVDVLQRMISEFEASRKTWEADRAMGRSPFPNPDAVIGYIHRELRRRAR